MNNITDNLRWLILLALNSARPIGASEYLLLAVIQEVYPDMAAPKMRRELDYLAGRALVELRKEPSGTWYADISLDGVYVVEYTVDCNSGIARPAMYWSVDNVNKPSELNAI